MNIVFLERTTVTVGDMDLTPFDALGEVTYCESYDKTEMRAAAKDAGMRVFGVYDKSSDEYTEDMKQISEKYISDFSQLL